MADGCWLFSGGLVFPRRDPARHAAARNTFPPMPHSPFSQSWADALRDTLNADAAYRDASKNWRWSLALAMDAEPSLGFPDSVAVELDLVNGSCERAEARPAAEVTSDYVLRGDYATWKSIVRDDVDAVSAVMSGKLKLVK